MRSHIYNPNTQEAGLLGVQGQPKLSNKFQASLSYRETLTQKKLKSPSQLHTHSKEQHVCELVGPCHQPSPLTCHSCSPQGPLLSMHNRQGSVSPRALLLYSCIGVSQMV